MKTTCRPLPVFLFVLLAALLVSGCGKYDTLERNMQYVSSDLLRKESVVAYERLRTAHAAWKASPGPATLDSYKDFYAQYRIIYNELMDRSGGGSRGKLPNFSEELPPAPPGVDLKQLRDAAKPAPAPTSPPEGRDIDDLMTTSPGAAGGTAAEPTLP